MSTSDSFLQPNRINVTVTLNWQRRGAVIPYFTAAHPRIPARWDEISFTWPGTPRDAGLYRITIIDPANRWIYIGESARVYSRLLGYRRLYRSRPRSTSSQLTVLVRKALIRGDPIYLDTAHVGKILLGNAQYPLAMDEKSERQFAEAAAVLQEEEAVGEGNDVVMNKVLNGRRRFVSTSEWDIPE